MQQGQSLAMYKLFQDTGWQGARETISRLSFTRHSYSVLFRNILWDSTGSRDLPLGWGFSKHPASRDQSREQSVESTREKLHIQPQVLLPGCTFHRNDDLLGPIIGRSELHPPSEAVTLRPTGRQIMGLAAYPTTITSMAAVLKTGSCLTVWRRGLCHRDSRLTLISRV